ncbi:MAG: trypsin-like peptidase domain-containing protein [bacterium]|nr:trypsin-like peptidase domain-containing protein [bacterium]
MNAVSIKVALLIVLLGLVGLGVVYSGESRELKLRLATLENQVGALAAALQSSTIVTEDNKKQLLELSNRSAVIARSQDELLTSAVSKAAPAVVSIVVSKDVPRLEIQYVNPFGDDPFFRDVGFRVPVYRQVGTEKQQIGAGTGFFIRSDGYILTNRHVVNDTQAEYVALLASGEKKTATVVYRDSTHDLAILKISGKGFPVIVLGHSSKLQLGQTVAAIGNALGEYNNTVSVGIISGLNRTIQAQDSQGRVETLSGVIQTDAAINRGNSGGPLLDLSGFAIGVNVAMEQGANNIAFSIPISVAKSIAGKVLP